MDELILKLLDFGSQMQKLVQNIFGYAPPKERCELKICKRLATIRVRITDSSNLDRRQTHSYYVCDNSTHQEMIERQNGWTASSRDARAMTKAQLELHSIKVLSDKDPSPLVRFRFKLGKRLADKRIKERERRSAMLNRPCVKCGRPPSGFYPNVCLCGDRPMTY